MEGFAVLIGLALAAYLLVAPGLGIAAFFRDRRRTATPQAAGDMRQQILALTEAIARLRQDVEALRGRTAPEEIIEPAAPIDVAQPAPTPTPATEPQAPPPPAVDEATAPAGLGKFEERLASRWILWVGAVALALGGTFLVKYAADEGWLDPAARVTLGFVFGCALTLAGEWLRQRPLERAIAALRTDYVPLALTTAGLFTAFASVYAAFALYDLIAPPTTFILLAAVSAAAVFLALLQGPFTALVGIIGGFVTPLLVPSQQPLAWALFAYLLFIETSALAVVRYTGARWLSLATLAGALLWPAIWLAGSWQPGDGAPVGAYLLLFLCAFLFVPHREPDPALRDRPFPDSIDPAILEAWLAAVATALLVFALLRMDAYGRASLLTLAVFATLSLYTGRRLAGFDPLPLLAEILAVAAIAAWHLPGIVTTTSPLYHYPQGYLAGPVVPPELTGFLSTNLGFAMLLGGGAYWLLWRARQPGWWAAVSATAPVLLLAVAYWRVTDFNVEIGWSGAALALAGIEVAAAARLAPHREEPAMNLSLAAYAAAAVAAIGLGATMALREAWLTVALAVEVAALGWLALRLQITALRPIAAAVAAVVLARLALNPEIVAYALGQTAGLNWILYGYGLPALCFAAAAGRFRKQRDDYLITLLELGAVAFVALLLTFEIHNLLAGPLDRPRRGLLEPSLHSIAWLALAIGLALVPRWAGRRSARWGRWVLAGLAVFQIVFVQLVAENPLWSGARVGAAPVFNQLLLAYGVPAALVIFYCWVEPLPPALRQAAGVLALLLVFANLSLEVRHWFQGSALSGGATTDAEWYAYSAAWLAYAGLLLALGIAVRSQSLRYASLAVLVVSIAKVFLSDMAQLTGLYRVASFIGLGLCLIAIGYFYQRFVLPLPPREKPA